MPAGKLIVDCGGVLSHQTSGRDKYDGRDIHKSAVEGAYAFVQKFIKKNGANNIHVLSRVNYISSDHWVVRFCRTLGLSPNHVTLVNDRRDKGPAALQLGCAAAIDDQSGVFVVDRHELPRAAAWQQALVSFQRKRLQTTRRGLGRLGG